MSKDEALKLALEALESADWYINQLEMIVYSVDDDGTHENRAKVQAAITAIKEALAQPDYPAVKTYHEGKPVYVSQPAQEPVQGQDSTCSDTLRFQGKPYPRTCKKCGLGPCIGKPVAQPEQKPVAWEQFYPDIGKPQLKQEPVKYEFQSTHDGKWYAFHDDKHYADDLADGRWPIRALYTTPPQRPWIGLTDEENLICLGFNKVLGLQYQEAKLKAVNGFLKEKNT